MTLPAPLLTARSLVGQVEDGPSILPLAQKIGQLYPEMASYCALVKTTTSWCGEFQAYCMAINGIRPPFNPSVDTESFLWALAWKDWGGAVTGTPEPGDVLVFEFPGNDHHVTQFDHDNGNGTWDCVGGNQSDQAKHSNYQASQCIAIRRPPAATSSPKGPPAADATFTASGRGSWYSQFSGKYQWVDKGDKAGSNALEVPDDCQGISFFDHATLGHWFEVEYPNGFRSFEQQTEIGPAPHTGRLIDISAVAAERAGYTPRNFPTDSIIKWRPIPVPLAVAALSPKQQAIQFAKLRKGSTMTDEPAPNQNPAVYASAADPMKAIIDTVLQQVLAKAKQDIKDHPEIILQILEGKASIGAFPTAQKSAPVPPPDQAATTPAPPAKPSTLGYGTGIMGLIGYVIANSLDMIGSPGGEHATMAGQIVPAVLTGITALGKSGTLATILVRLAPKLATLIL